MKRRDFIKKASCGAAGLAAVNFYEMIDGINAHAFPTNKGMGIEEVNYYLERGKEKNTRPEVRQEIKNNPRAVFLIETDVEAKKDATGHFSEAVGQLRDTGGSIARSLFVKGTKRGGTTFIKPNFTGIVSKRMYTRTNGVYSSPDFVVGMVEHLRSLGNTNVACGESPVNALNHRLGGVYDALDPYGVMMIEAGYDRFEHYNKNEINWSDPVDSPVWNRIPYYKPILEDDTFFVNIATMKCHPTSITTLTVKNLQGCVIKGHGQFCWPGIQLELQSDSAGINFKRGFKKDAIQNIEELFVKHRKAGFKGWETENAIYDRYIELGGYKTYKKVKKDVPARRAFLKEVGNLFTHESWMHRGLDNAQFLKPDLNIIEGVIAMDGNAHGRKGIGDNYLVNTVIAGCSPFEVDAVGTYIMGHDPNEVWYTRVAKEKGYGECDINKIDIYWIREGEIIPVKNIAELKRHRIGLNMLGKEGPEVRHFW